MATQKKTTQKRTTGKRKTQPKKRPIRREIGGWVCLLLALCVGVSYFQRGAILIDQLSTLLRGLLGYGYYAALAALLLAAYILLFHHGRAVAAPLAGTLLLPLLIGAITHLIGGQTQITSSSGSVKLLWESGLALSSGGAAAGGAATLLTAVLGKVASLVVLFVLLAACLLLALRLTPAGIVETLRSRERIPYEPEELPVRQRPAPRSARDVRRVEYQPIRGGRASIDIPLDGEERPRKTNEKKTGFFTHKSDGMKTPDEVLASRGAAAAETAQTLPAAAKAEKAAIEEPHRIMPEPIVPAASRPEAPVQTSRPPVVSADDAGQKETADKLAKAEVAAAAQDVAREIAAGEAAAPEYRYPPITLLDQGSGTNAEAAGAELRNNSRRLAETLKSFGVEATAGDVVRGPSVTRYEFMLDQGVKLSKITNLQDDIALALGASGVRIAPIPDKISVVGVEVPNKLVSPVYIRSVLESREFTTHKSNVAFAVGKDISGKNIIGNISKLPHVLIAGTTGSGKSVCTNSLIISMLYKSTPEEVRFIMVDPKMVELAPYNGIPHLLIPVVTDPKKAAGALQWAVYEMMKRYKLFSEHNVKELAAFNALAKTDPTLKKLPTVVVVIDELADLMLVAAKEVEESICRVAQMGRAAGMHLVIATQRPSADVITGLMKANIPSRIAFAVASSLESRIILDSAGAEKLVGRGDMLYAPLGEGKPRRVQGCLITAEEIERVVDFVKENGETSYDKDVIEKIEQNVAEKEKGGKSAPVQAEPAEDDGDEMLPAAIEVVLETGQASVYMLQRRLKLGYSRAARLVDQMEERGIVGPFEGSKPRQLLVTREQWQEIQMKGEQTAAAENAETEE